MRTLESEPTADAGRPGGEGGTTGPRRNRHIPPMIGSGSDGDRPTHGMGRATMRGKLPGPAAWVGRWDQARTRHQTNWRSILLRLCAQKRSTGAGRLSADRQAAP